MASRRYQLKYNHTTDAEIIARLDSQESIQGYIRRLILADIAADKLLNLQEDIKLGLQQKRIGYWEKHCVAVQDPEANDGDPCAVCSFLGSVGFTDQRSCQLEQAWNEEKKNHDQL